MSTLSREFLSRMRGRAARFTEEPERGSITLEQVIWTAGIALAAVAVVAARKQSRRLTRSRAASSRAAWRSAKSTATRAFAAGMHAAGVLTRVVRGRPRPAQGGREGATDGGPRLELRGHLLDAVLGCNVSHDFDLSYTNWPAEHRGECCPIFLLSFGLPNM